MRSRFDPLNFLMLGYPLAALVGFWLWPDVTGVVMLIGAVVGVPLFVLQGRGEQRIEGRGLPWFQAILVGISFAWPFIIFTLVRALRRRERGATERDERDYGARE